jgi:hypothetical protein
MTGKTINLSEQTYSVITKQKSNVEEEYGVSLTYDEFVGIVFEVYDTRDLIGEGVSLQEFKDVMRGMTRF